MKIKKLADKKDILIVGESGTGKRYTAYQIHQARSRKASYVLLDGLSTNHAELEAVLLGKQRDLAHSLTGHDPAKLANHTTLCVANLDALGSREQELIANFLKNHRKDYTGICVILTAVHPAKVMIDVATFERVEVPALRDRTEDLPELVKSILQSLGKESLTVGDGIIRVLEKSSWPENTRELVNVVSKGVLISKGDMLELPEECLNEHQHIQNAMEHVAALRSFNLDNTLWLIEKLLIEKLLKATQNNQSRAADLMQLSEANFRYRLKKFGVPAVRKRG